MLLTSRISSTTASLMPTPPSAVEFVLAGNAKSTSPTPKTQAAPPMKTASPLPPSVIASFPTAPLWTWKGHPTQSSLDRTNPNHPLARTAKLPKTKIPPPPLSRPTCQSTKVRSSALTTPRVASLALPTRLPLPRATRLTTSRFFTRRPPRLVRTRARRSSWAVIFLQLRHAFWTLPICSMITISICCLGQIRMYWPWHCLRQFIFGMLRLARLMSFVMWRIKDRMLTFRVFHGSKRVVVTSPWEHHQ
mmetsp:Transcript_17174/g.30850  ORF Transcript_17174/g.30850 Transcript_17174/m.30850 type:complete len:248 (-) Transcript_17174:142-885(-)